MAPLHSDRPDETEQPLYREVADHVERLVDDGTFGPGQRLPSLRRLSRQLSVSVTTVQEAYRVLEDRGAVEVRPQSGHYVRLCPRSAPPEPERMPGVSGPVALDKAELIERMVQEASQPGLVVPFGAAVPQAEFLPTGRLNTLLARAVRREPIAIQAYDNLSGREELRVEIARRALEAGCTLSPDEIVVTTGAQEAISLGLRAVTKPGDVVALESPTYHGFLQVLESLHLEAREIATDPREGICLVDLEEALDRDGVAACLLVPSFGNPLGHSMAVEDRRALVDLARRYDVALLEDDTYGEVFFGDARPPAVRSFDTDGRVLLLSSFSKTLVPGFRVGWIAPGRFRKQVLQQKFATTLATPTPTQMAIADYLAGGGMDRHLRKLRGTFKDLVRRMNGAVGRAFPPGTCVTRPSGGFVLWVEMPPEVDAFRLYREALAEGISVIPGPIFSASGRYGHCLRISCAVDWSASVERAVARLGELAARQLEG